MRLLGVFILSLWLHFAVIQWMPTVEVEATGSPSKATLNIQQMHFVTEIAKPLVEKKILSDLSEKVTEVTVENFIKNEVRETVELKPQAKSDVVELVKESPKRSLITKQQETIKKDSKEQVLSEKKIEPVREDEIVIEQADPVVEPMPSDEQQKIETPKVELAVVPNEVVSETEAIPDKSGLDEIPTMEEPRYRKAFAPKYPNLAKKRGQQGLVLLRAKVDQLGEVETIEIIQSSGINSLDVRALETVEKWLFHPYKVGNKPTAAWVNIPVDFTLR